MLIITRFYRIIQISSILLLSLVALNPTIVKAQSINNELNNTNQTVKSLKILSHTASVYNLGPKETTVLRVVYFNESDQIIQNPTLNISTDSRFQYLSCNQNNQVNLCPLESGEINLSLNPLLPQTAGFVEYTLMVKDFSLLGQADTTAKIY